MSDEDVDETVVERVRSDIAEFVRVDEYADVRPPVRKGERFDEYDALVSVRDRGDDFDAAELYDESNDEIGVERVEGYEGDNYVLYGVDL
jgi:hypothetical protein